MRSLTSSSAGISPAVPFSLSSSRTLSTHYATPDLVVIQQGSTVAHANSCSILSSSSNPSFFNMTDTSNAISLSARKHVSQAIQNGWAASTIKRYSSMIKQFIHFCDKEQVQEHLRFPADKFLLCAFAASSLGRHAIGTPQKCLSILKAWHLAHNLEWRGSLHLRYVLNGVQNLAPGSSVCRPRPVRSNVLKVLLFCSQYFIIRHNVPVAHL